MNTINTQKFKIKSGEEPLVPKDFAYWPAWSEYYDFDEIDLIESWGIDREKALKTFQMYDTGGAHSHYTILDTAVLPFENMRIYLLAEFITPSGAKLAGFIMNKAELCISIFGKNSEYIFSNHPMLKTESEQAEKGVINEFSISELFPLKFETQFTDEEGNPLIGEYEI